MARTAYTSEEAQRIREQLLGIAMTLYLESGLEGVTLRHIAARSGLSHSIAYRYFDSKESLLDSLRITCLEQFYAAMQSGDLHGAPPLQRVRAMLVGALAFGTQHAAQYRLVFTLPQPDLDTHPALREKRRDVFNACVALVQMAVDEGSLHTDAITFSHGLWSLLHGMLSLHTAGQLDHTRSLADIAMPMIDHFLGIGAG